MKFPKISAYLFGFAAVAGLALGSCKKDSDPEGPDTGDVDVEMENVVGGTALMLNGPSAYVTPAGDQFTVSTFKYYVSNFELVRADGSAYTVPESYFLVDEAKNDSKTFTLKDVPAGDYNSLRFVIGVDSARCVSDPAKLTGDLNPSNEMHWGWNTGFIFLKFEGNSPQSSAPAGALSYHVGGFKAPNNVIRTVSLAFPGGQKLMVRPDHAPEMHLKADLLRLFSGSTAVRFGTMPNLGHGGGAAAMQIAGNYSGSPSAKTVSTNSMFTVDHIHTH